MKTEIMLELDNIAIEYQRTRVVDGLNLSLKAGQIGCLLGPSGCGKTSILRAIAGFEPVAQGQISLRNELVSQFDQQVSADKRRISVVFQDFALFPHLNVTDNIAFGLHKLSRSQKNLKVEQMLELVGLEQHKHHYPYQLSGGQQQRVALARAMAPEPELLLLDEPFSSLDAELRDELATEIRQILKGANTTALMVTHDQHEAFAMADIIGVLEQGKLHQWDDAYRLYHKPASRFVADFIGNGVFLTANLVGVDQLETGLGRFNLPSGHLYNSAQQLELLVRPDDIVHCDNSGHWGTVKSRAFKGAHILYELEINNQSNETVLCLAPSHHDHKIGERFGIRLDLAHLIVFDRQI
jgi:iron(III) transport system ATP-binding protein